MILLAGLALAMLQGDPLGPYLDPTLSPSMRAHQLVALMTTDEKIAQCMMDAPAIKRLGVPSYHYWNEALHGVARNGIATVFPQAIGLAATWDPALIQQVGSVISTEARAKYRAAQEVGNHQIYHGLTLWSPNVNQFRDPRWGRGQETYGEDPFLTGQIGVGFIKGIQGDDPKYLKAVATPKHFAVHSGPEPLRHGFDAQVTEEELYDTYLPAFEACIREGHAASIMSAYSGFNGVPCTGNPALLTEILRDRWGFDGAVVSDVDSVGDIFYGHHQTKDLAEAAAMALKAGNDECSGQSYRALRQALNRGLIKVADLNRAAERLFTLRFRLGMFDGPAQCAYQRIETSDNDTLEHEKLALTAAEKSLVLLKNDGVLPLKTVAIHQVAVIGPVANQEDVLLGNYNGTSSRPVTLLDGITKKLGAKGVHVESLAGCPLVNGESAAAPFPSGVLFTDESCATAGLSRQVFAGTRLTGSPIQTETDSNIKLAWNPLAPLAGIPATQCSIRWSGVIRWQKTEKVGLTVAADDGVRLYIDNQLIIDQWHIQSKSTYSTTVKFEAGKPHRIRLEYYQAEGDAAIEFGYQHQANPKFDFSAVKALVGRSDLVVLTLGITPNLEGEEMNVHSEGFLGGDRTSLELPGPQRELLETVSHLGKPVVLVLTGGSALAFDPSKTNATLLQWYSGEQGGEAVAQALLGETNPSGRLPITLYRSVNDLPRFENYHMTGRTYRYFSGQALFPFGHGLSYSKFAYGNPIASKKKMVAAGTLNLSLPIKNDGPVSGEEVVQVYASRENREPWEPIKRLIGFTRIEVPVGMSKTVKFQIPVERLRLWNSKLKNYRVPAGHYLISIGASSRDIRKRISLQVEN